MTFKQFVREQMLIAIKNNLGVKAATKKERIAKGNYYKSPENKTYLFNFCNKFPEHPLAIDIKKADAEVNIAKAAQPVVPFDVTKIQALYAYLRGKQSIKKFKNYHGPVHYTSIYYDMYTNYEPREITWAEFEEFVKPVKAHMETIFERANAEVEEVKSKDTP